MRRVRMVLAGLAASALVAVAAAPAAAYGGGADHAMWQIGLSFNCNNAAACDGDQGGFWGWAEFDRSSDGSTWGDAELAECFHGTVSGNVHISVDAESWTIAPGSAGPQTFFINGQETDSFRGTSVTYDVAGLDTEIPAVPGHYSTDQVLGFDAPPGVAIQIQVAYRPAR
jgi:hypothetical protein